MQFWEATLPWDARKLDDRSYHRRRLVIAGFAMFWCVVTAALTLSDVLAHGVNAKDAIVLFALVVGIAFLGGAAVSEFRSMRSSPAAGGSDG